MTTQDVALLLFAYFIGSISSAILICRLFKLPDPRTQGSGNPGATNVMRLGGKWPALFTLAGDFLKGLLPVLLAKEYATSLEVVGFALLLSFLGHLYPVFFKFQGGKGVATAFGGLLGLSGWAALGTFAIWILVFLCFRISSLSALLAALCAPIFIHFFLVNVTLTTVMSVASSWLLWRHRENILRILNGQEKQLKK